MNILIISNLFGNNRQGYDLAGVLRERGHRVRLVQFTNDHDVKTGNLGVKFTKPHGVFSKFHVLLNLFRIFRASLFCKKDVVVCIGAPILLVGAFYKIFFGAKLVYYSLEYAKYGCVYAKIVKHLVDRYIDVEENRCKKVYEDLKLSVPSMVVYNLPGLAEYTPKSGKLRQYLKEHRGATGDEKILIYAGSYQWYAQIENLVRASERFSDDVILVLMVSWGLPEDLQKSVSLKHCKIVPPQSGTEFFDWLSDADCALLPYEDEREFNVRNCSPQKLFDCYLVGIPFLGSDRPIIRRVLAEFSGAGILCDFTNLDSICAAVPKTLELKNAECSRRMKDLCREKYNYGCYADQVTRFICDEKGGGTK